MSLEAARHKTEVGPSNCDSAATNSIALRYRRVFGAVTLLNRIKWKSTMQNVREELVVEGDLVGKIDLLFY